MNTAAQNGSTKSVITEVRELYMGWNDMRRFFVTLCDAQRRTAPWPAKTEKEIENQRTLCFNKLYAVAVKVNNVRFL